MCISCVYLGSDTYSGRLVRRVKTQSFILVCVIVLNTLPPGPVVVAEGDLRQVCSTTNGRGAVEIYSRLGWDQYLSRRRVDGF